MKRIALLVVAASLAMVPLVNSAAQSGGNGVQDDIGDTDEITFYGHVFGHTLDQPMPANVEAPIGEDNYGIGSVDWCTPAGSANTAPSVRPGETCDQNPNHKLALFSTAGLVDVETRSGFQAGGDYAQLHNERGQTKAIELDGSGSITATVYITTDFHGWLVGAGDTNCPTPHPENVPCLYPYWGWDAGVNPSFVVEATLYSADLGSRTNASEAPPVREAIESGNAEVIAEGQWGPGQAMTGLPGSPNAQQFEIDLGAPQITTIPKTHDFFLVYDTYTDTPGGEVGTHFVRWWSGEFFPPTFTMPVKNAFTVEKVVPNFAHGKLAMLGIINTPWGSYDIDQDSVKMSVTGPDGNAVNPSELTRFADFSVAHGGHYKPVNITWVWDYQREGLQPGEYTVTVSAANFQNSAAATCEATFTLEEGSNGGVVPGSAEDGVCGTQSETQQDTEDLQAQPDDGGS